MHYIGAVALALLVQSIDAQTSAGAEPVVPTGTPIPGNYTGALRPQVHFSPPQFFMNDPNGMFQDTNGTWHLYYQYNPTGLTAGNQHWGHATSRDLYHWSNQPIALFPPTPSQLVFSGSAVTDPNNTSGFFPNQDNGVVAIYTLATYDPNPGPQTQNVAYSYDGGFTFIPYEGNPVIDSTSNQFRDPKVFWYEDHWVLVVAYAVEFTIGIFTSPDLKTWTHASNFSHHGLLGLQYECPNLVEMPVEGSEETMWVMFISINPGAPLGGSISQYFPGSFNGTHFEPVDDAARISDFAKDNYAGQFFYGLSPTEDAVSIAWASNWQYTQDVPTGPLEGWRSAMTVPRRNFLTNATRIGWVMASLPYDLSPIVESELASNASLGNGTVDVDYSSLYSKSVHISLNLTNIPSSPSGSITLIFSSSSQSSNLTVGITLGGDATIYLDRGNIRGFDNPYFTDKFSTNTVLSGSWNFEAIIDRSILEVFLDGGRFSATTVFFPEEGEELEKLNIAVDGLSEEIEASLSVWGLKSPWKDLQGEDGLVAGNVTNHGDPA